MIDYSRAARAPTKRTIAFAFRPARRPPYHPAVVPEAELEETEAGLVPASVGWFVMNARDARWFDKPGQGHSVPLTGYDEYEAETFFPMLGMAIRVVSPGEPTGTYHWETEQEDFLVLSGEGLLKGPAMGLRRAHRRPWWATCVRRRNRHPPQRKLSRGHAGPSPRAPAATGPHLLLG